MGDVDMTALSAQEPAAGMNYVILLTCAVCLGGYAVMAVILRKLDQLDLRHIRVIPFCGKRGRFKYEILVKTGWGRGSGECRLLATPRRASLPELLMPGQKGPHCLGLTGQHQLCLSVRVTAPREMH